jgi:hypothetical protein
MTFAGGNIDPGKPKVGFASGRSTDAPDPWGYVRLKTWQNANACRKMPMRSVSQFSRGSKILNWKRNFKRGSHLTSDIS